MQRQKRSDRLRRDSSIPNIFPFFSQVQELGLQEAYANDRGTHDVLRKLMALPFLPAEKIKLRFLRLQEKATTEALKTFTAYIQKTWITGDTFPPTTWSVYMQAVRTNNDLEGWHNGLNRRAKGKAQLPLYVLIQLLHKEALCQIKGCEDTSGRPTKNCRRGYSSCGTNMRTMRNIPSSC